VKLAERLNGCVEVCYIGVVGRRAVTQRRHQTNVLADALTWHQQQLSQPSPAINSLLSTQQTGFLPGGVGPSML